MRAAVLATGVALMAVVSSCSSSGQTAGTPTPAPPASSSSQEPNGPAPGGEQVPGYGAPKVDTPLEASRFEAAPCTTLTPEQVTQLLGNDVPPPKQENVAGPSCSWRVPFGGGHVVITYSNLDDRGVTTHYRNKNQPGQFFQELGLVDGYPLVAYSADGDPRNAGYCPGALGITDRKTIDIGVFQSDKNKGKKDPCASVKEIAGMVVANLKAG